MKVVLKSPHAPDRFLKNLSSAAHQVCSSRKELAGQSWNEQPARNLVIDYWLGASELKMVFEKEQASKGIVVKFDSRDAKRVKEIMDWLCESYASLFDEKFEVEWLLQESSATLPSTVMGSGR